MALALIGPQTILLGATFPLMSAGILRALPDSSGSKIALLYFSNSAGAAAGVLCAAFVLIPWSGLPGSMLSAALVNMAVALLAWLLVKSSPLRPAPAPQSAGKSHAARTRFGTPLLLLATALFTGLASFVYEVLWVRMLTMVLGASTHSFELMLSAFIAGLAFGSLAIRRRIARITQPFRFLGYVQIVMGAFALGSLWVYNQSFGWMALLMQGVARTDQGYTVVLIASHMLCFLVMLPATFMAGMTLPLITDGLLRHGHGERAIGAVYAWNTVGGIAGVLLTIHFLIPVLGLKASMVLGAGIDMMTGLALVLMAAGMTFEPLLAGAAVLTLTGLSAWGLTLDPRKMTSGVYRYARAQLPDGNEILSHRDGKTATISTLRNGNARSLLINGKPDATIMPFSAPPTGDEITSVLLAGLGMLHHPQARSVASIGLGSGVTTRVLLKNPHLQSVSTIEIEAQIVSAVHQLSDQTGEVFSDPRSRIVVDDAKSYFAATRSKFDLILAQPSNPWVSGIASLFTTEFYRRMLDHMTEQGVFVQWVQTYESDYESISSVTRALGSAFANYTVYAIGEGDLLIVAWKDKRPLEPDTALLSSPRLKAEFSRAGIEGLPDIEALRVGGRSVLEPLLLSFPAPENSDYFPFLDSRAARARIASPNGARLDVLRLSALPLIELLERRERPYRDTRMGQNPYGANATLMKNAQALHHTLMNVKPDAVINPGTRLNLGILKSFCDKTGAFGHGDALHAYVGLAVATVPFLTKPESRQLLKQLISRDCLSRIGPSAESYELLFEHVLHRNGKGMLELGRRLLDTGKVNADPRVTNLARDAAVAGAVLEGSAQTVADLWQRHGVMSGTVRDIPLDSRLMLAAAGIVLRDRN